MKSHDRNKYMRLVSILIVLGGCTVVEVNVKNTGPMDVRVSFSTGCTSATLDQTEAEVSAIICRGITHCSCRSPILDTYKENYVVGQTVCLGRQYLIVRTCFFLPSSLISSHCMKQARQ